ncbi:MAG: type II secretion system F family protein [Verrucomicrobiales bacterium]|nr:type II secretion system F family protein [Verrucomicrobiales bacterium]
MNPEELSFVTQQLAGMLRSGIPLEGALRQLSSTMKSGRLCAELERLEQDLARGLPLSAALEQRQLPALLKCLLRVGQASNDLPGVLLLLADYYRKAGDLMTRMNGLLIYPLIILIACLILSALLAAVFTPFIASAEPVVGFSTGLTPASATFLNLMLLQLWLPLILILVVSGLWVAGARSARVRQWLRWRVPGFREASFSRLAAALSLMISRGCPVSEAVALLQQVETGSRVQAELLRWQLLLAGGVTRFTDLTRESLFFPPLFVWIVAGSGEDWGAGFRRAAEIYHGRALYRFELMLYAALPVSICFLGLLLVVQLSPLYFVLSRGVGDLLQSAGGF